MMNLKHLIERRALLLYFILAYLIAWGGILLVIGPGGLQPAATRQMDQGLLVFVAMLTGPSLAGLTLTAALRDPAGLRRPAGSQATRWYAVALLTTPLVLLALGALLTVVSPVFIPRLIVDSDKAAVLGFALMIGLLAGFFEEIGWTGFALPRLLARNSVVKTGLLLGLLWGVWHLLGDYWGNAGAFGSLYPLRGLLWLLTLTAYRVLMVWIYSKTRSLVLMQLMHASFTGGQIMLEPPLAPADYLLWYGAFSLALSVLVLLVVVRPARLPQISSVSQD